MTSLRDTLRHGRPRKPHNLATREAPFVSILDGSRTFDIRKVADQSFEIGDHLLFFEVGSSHPCKATGRCVGAVVTNVLDVHPGLYHGYASFSFYVLSKETAS